MREIEAERQAMAAATPTFVCTAEGVFIWPGVALVERRGADFVRASDHEICHRAASLHGPSIIGSPLIPTLDRAARLLQRGEIEKAQASIAHLELPSLSTLGEALTRGGAAGWWPSMAKTFDPERHPRWPAGSPDDAGGRFRPGDDGSEASSSVDASRQVAQELLPFFARPPVVPGEQPRFQEPIPRLSGKEGAKDVPSWVRGQRPYVGENGRDFAKRVLDEKYGPGKWDENGEEYGRIQKYGDRNFRDPKAVVPPDDDEA